jgi:hypothetical protein
MFGRRLIDVGNITHHLRQSALFHRTWNIVEDKFGDRAALVVSPSEVRCQRNPDILVPSKRPSSPYFTQVLGRRLYENEFDDPVRANISGRHDQAT